MRLNVHLQPMLLHLINIGYQLFLHFPNQGMPMLKNDTIKNT